MRQRPSTFASCRFFTVDENRCTRELTSVGRPLAVVVVLRVRKGRRNTVAEEKRRDGRDGGRVKKYAG